MAEITVHIKCSNADKTVVVIDTSSTVGDLKEKINEQMHVPASQQRLIYKGRVLKDEATIESYGVENEHTVHMVKSAGSTSAPPNPIGNSTRSAPLPAPLPTFASPSATSAYGIENTSNTFGNPFAAMNAAGGAGGMGDVNRLREQLLQSPEMMEQIMNSPMMQSLMDNPEVMRNMMMSNPEMQGILNSNPELRQMLNDPSVLRQSMEMMRNPNAMRQAMRSQDLAMSQLENLPGGFNALRNMFENVQQPMMDAAQNSNATSSSFQSQSSAPPTAPVNSALPNPWGGGGAQSTNGNPMSSPFGSSAFGNIGGMGGMDPAQSMSMLQNPAMQQMLAQAMQNPAFLNQMAAQDPMMAQALQNPQMRAMLSNPEFLRRMSDPTTMQAMMQMQQSMRTLQQAGMMPPMGGFDSLGSSSNSGGIGGGLDFTTLFGGNALPGNGFPVMPPTVPAQNPEDRYAAQLQQLQDMGFGDRDANLRALQATSGNVNAAVERLLGGL